MKLVDTDECDRKEFYKELGTKDGKDVCIFAETVFDMLEALPPVNAIPIPEGATNGDMLKAMFPLVEVKEKNNGYEVYFGIGTSTQYFNHQWWNALFEK